MCFGGFTTPAEGSSASISPCEMANRLNHRSAAFLALMLGLLAPAAMLVLVDL